MRTGAANAVSLDAIAPGRPIQLPRDFGAHPQARIEWWYVTGWLEAFDGDAARPGQGAQGATAAGIIGASRRTGAAGTDASGSATSAAPVPADGRPSCGFQLTFFRVRTGLAEGHPSRFAAQQLLFAHAAVTDLQARRLRHDERIARAGFGIAEASTIDTRLALQGWRLERLERQEPERQGVTAGASAATAPKGPPASSADAALSAPHHYLAHLASPAQGFVLDLRFAATQPVLLQGEAGYSRKGPEPAQASHYLSEPQLATSGTLELDGRRRAVRGRAWLDHEWSDSLLDPGAVGWDWIGMNLADGGALTAFRLRRADGSALWAGGSHRPAGGAARSFGPQEVVFTPLRHWTSPATQARYPVDWRVETPAGRFEVRALLDAQELDSRGFTGTAYWEGLSELLEAGAQAAGGGATRVVGLGYLEMTGYAGRLRL